MPQQLPLLAEERATFVAYNYNTPVDVAAFEAEARRILAEVEAECGWMYETWHPHCDHPQRVKARINYTVWSIDKLLQIG